jgi:hypothetical protein
VCCLRLLCSNWTDHTQCCPTGYINGKPSSFHILFLCSITPYDCPCYWQQIIPSVVHSEHVHNMNCFRNPWSISTVQLATGLRSEGFRFIAVVLSMSIEDLATKLTKNTSLFTHGGVDKFVGFQRQCAPEVTSSSRLSWLCCTKP